MSIHFQPKHTSGMKKQALLGLRLKAIREQRGITQQELAELIDRSVESVSNIERGAAEPSLETLARLSKSLNVTIADLAEPYESSRKTDANRTRAEASILEITKQLDGRNIKIALDQMSALLRSQGN